MRALVVVVALGCSGKKPEEPAPRPVPVTVDAAVIVDAPIVIDAPPDAAQLTRVDPMTLPAIAVEERKGEQSTSIYALDMDAGLLLVTLARSNYIGKPIDKKFTGRIDRATPEAAYAAIAKELGVDIKSPKVTGRGVNVDLQFANAPVIDLFRVLGDVGRVNVVVPGKVGHVDIAMKRAPWDGVLVAVTALEGRTLFASGNTRYILPAGTSLPPLPKLPGN